MPIGEMVMKNSEYKPAMVKSMLSEQEISLVKELVYSYIDKDYTKFIKHKNGMHQIEFEDKIVYDIFTKELESMFNKEIIEIGIFFSRYLKVNGLNPELQPHLDNYNPGTQHGLTFTYVLDSSLDWDIYYQDKQFEIKKNDIVILSGSSHAHWRPQIVFDETDYYDIIVGHFILKDSEDDKVVENFKELMEEEKNKYWGLWNDSKQS
jgi:hypothetical protein